MTAQLTARVQTERQRGHRRRGQEHQRSRDEEDPSGSLRIVLAGDGEIDVEVEALDLRLEDVTRPYLAPSGKAPTHPEA